MSLPLDSTGSHWSSQSRVGPGAMDYSGQGPVYPSKPSLTLVLLQVRHPASPGFFLTCQSISILKTKSVSIPDFYRHNQNKLSGILMSIAVESVMGFLKRCLSLKLQKVSLSEIP